MNLLYKRELSTMVPRLKILKDQIEIIRPMAYLEKRYLTEYIKEIEAPVIPVSCPAKEIKKDLRREKVRNILKNLVKEDKRFENNIFASFRNPSEDYLLNHLYNPRRSGLHRRP